MVDVFTAHGGWVSGCYSFFVLAYDKWCWFLGVFHVVLFHFAPHHVKMSLIRVRNARHWLAGTKCFNSIDLLPNLACHDVSLYSIWFSSALNRIKANYTEMKACSILSIEDIAFTFKHVHRQWIACRGMETNANAMASDSRADEWFTRMGTFLCSTDNLWKHFLDLPVICIRWF